MRVVHGRGRSRKGRLMTMALAMGCFAVASLVPVATASASSGTFTVSGQASGKMTETLCLIKKKSETIPFNNTTLKINGHSVHGTYLITSLQVAKFGKTEKITKTGTANYVTFSLNVGSKYYGWWSTSGTITTKAKGNGGSFHATLGPTSGDAGKATKTVTLSGSWPSCSSGAP